MHISQVYLKEIFSIAEGKLDVDGEFARNVFKLARNGIKEMRIFKKELRRYSLAHVRFEILR